MPRNGHATILFVVQQFLHNIETAYRKIRLVLLKKTISRYKAHHLQINTSFKFLLANVCGMEA